MRTLLVILLLLPAPTWAVTALALGDSLTEAGGPYGAGTYVDFLSDVTVNNIAVNGRPSGYWADPDNLPSEVVEDWVLAHVGTVDANPTINTPAVLYSGNITGMVTLLADRGATQILLICPPPRTGSSKPPVYCAELQAICSADPSVYCVDPGMDSLNLGPDGIHPVNAGYTQIAEAVQPFLGSKTIPCLPLWGMGVLGLLLTRSYLV